MKFTTPAVLWTLLAVPALAGLWMAAGRRAGLLVRKLVAARLYSQLVGEPAGRLPRFILLLAGLTLALFALARPQWGELAAETKGRGRDVIILVDVSRSMLATDLPPSRLQRAKLAAEDLVRQLPADRIGLVAFAGSAFLQAPVTADHAAILTAIHELDPDIIPLQGTNLCGALECAKEAFEHSESGQRALVLLTDGEELEEDAVALAHELAAKMRIFTVGVGSPEGSVLMVPSPRGGTEYIRDAAGNIVQSKLDETRLVQIAEAGGGFYTRLLSGPAEMRHIALEGIELMEEHDILLQSQTHAIDRYQWPLGAGVLFVAVGLCLGEKPKRKGMAAAILLGGLALGVTPTTHATTPQGRLLYNSGDYAGAQQAFGNDLSAVPDSPERAFNLGTAAYKNQKWAEAIEAFGKALSTQDPQLRSRAEYNLANALVQQARKGRRGQDNRTLEQAVAHYDEASKRDPAFEDAKVNREFVKQLLAQKEQQQQKDEGDEDKKQDKKQDKKNEKDAQKKNKQKKDEQSDESKEDNEDSDGQKGEDGQDKQQSKKGGKDKNQPGEQGEQDKQSGKQGQDTAKDGQAPQPVEEKPGEEKKRGELKDSPTVERQEKGESKDKQGQEAQMAQGDGKMTREQASALLEALRSEDRRVQLWAPNKSEGPTTPRSGKTW